MNLTKKYAPLSEEMVYPGMFDLPKGVFMLDVLIYHAFMAVYPVWEYRYAAEPLKKLAGVAINLRGLGWVPLLFLCCGYTWRKRKPEKAVKGQVSSLLVPYAITGAAVTAMALLSGLLQGNVPAELRYTSLPFLLGFCPGASFLGIEMNSVGALWCVVAFFFGGILLNWILQEKEYWAQISLVVLMMCAGLLLTRWVLPFCVQQTLLCIGYMYLGWLMKKTGFLTRKIPAYLIVLFALAGFGMGALGYYDMSHYAFKNGAVDLIAGLLAGLTLLVLLLNMNRLEGRFWSFLRWMGRENFLICCVHSFTMVMPSVFLGVILLPFYQSNLPKPVLVLVMLVFYGVTGVGGAYCCKAVSRLLHAKQKRL